MPASIEVGHPNLHTPRSPTSISTDSSRRGSVKQVLSEKSPEPLTPSSQGFRLTRKRAASLQIESVNDPRIEELALNSASFSGLPGANPAREQVCLCQPDPKIPRPRNGVWLSCPLKIRPCDSWFLNLSHFSPLSPLLRGFEEDAKANVSL